MAGITRYRRESVRVYGLASAANPGSFPLTSDPWRSDNAYSDRWVDWERLRPLGSGIGFTLEPADEVACTTRLGDVLTYAEDELNRVTDAKGRLAAFPECQTPAHAEDVHTLYDLPIWGVLMRPCMVHVHRHLGEIEPTKRMLRTE